MSVSVEFPTLMRRRGLAGGVGGDGDESCAACDGGRKSVGLDEGDLRGGQVRLVGDPDCAVFKVVDGQLIRHRRCVHTAGQPLRAVRATDGRVLRIRHRLGGVGARQPGECLHAGYGGRRFCRVTRVHRHWDRDRRDDAEDNGSDACVSGQLLATFLLLLGGARVCDVFASRGFDRPTVLFAGGGHQSPFVGRSHRGERSRPCSRGVVGHVAVAGRTAWR